MLPYERQLAEKEAQVREALERIGGFDEPPVEAIVPAVEPLRYRNKVEYSFGDGDDGELRAGLSPARTLGPHRRRERGHPRLGAGRRAARGGQGLDARAEGLSAYDRRDHTGLLRNLVVREGRRTGQLQARVVTSPGDFRALELAAALPAESVLWTQAAAWARPRAAARPSW